MIDVGARAALRRRIELQDWTAHNVRLADDFETLPGRPPLDPTDLRLVATLRLLTLTYGSQLDRLRILDLGCLEGGVALALARRGCEVVGVEARASNLVKAELLREWFGLERLTFVLADVKDVDAGSFGQFDVVLALGILYHLDRPAAWLRQVADLTRGALVIDTHVAPADEGALRRLRPELSALSAPELELVGGTAYLGRWFTEWPADMSAADREAQVWASWSNDRSFWLTERSLVRAVRDAGFDTVVALCDANLDADADAVAASSRGMWAGLRVGAAP